MSDDAARTADSRLFHAHGAATENDWSPRVDRLTGGTIRVAVSDEFTSLKACSICSKMAQP